jgi:hypothetical protein
VRQAGHLAESGREVVQLGLPGLVEPGLGEVLAGEIDAHGQHEGAEPGEHVSQVAVDAGVFDGATTPTGTPAASAAQ